jgi:hypothetical protein
MNRLLVGGKGLSKIVDLPETVAFGKGVEWFTEVFFFYGILAILAIWELNHLEVSRLK